jgi:hypothetical protein
VSDPWRLSFFDDYSSWVFLGHKITGGQEVNEQMRLEELLTIDEMADRLKVKKSWLYFRSMQSGEGAIHVSRSESIFGLIPVM